MSLPHGVIVCSLLIAAGLITAGQAQDSASTSDSATDKEVKAARMEHMKLAAKGYEIALASAAADKVILTEEPLLRFDDQVTGVLDGTVFVWTSDERPVAIASVWIRKVGQEFHEFQSLADGALTASNQGRAKWIPAEPGIEMQPAPAVQPPAATASRRLNQMRAFAREYSATVRGWEENRQVLRLLPQPVYRYGRPDRAVADGAIFAYCKGTNPEVLLLVQAVKTGEELQWQYAFARMSSRECEVRREDQMAWSVPLVRTESPTAPYFNVVQPYTGPGVEADSAARVDE